MFVIRKLMKENSGKKKREFQRIKSDENLRLKKWIRGEI